MQRRGHTGSAQRVDAGKFTSNKIPEYRHQEEPISRDVLQDYSYSTSFIGDKLNTVDKKVMNESPNEHLANQNPTPVSYATNTDNHLQDVKMSLHEHVSERGAIPGMYILAASCANP